MRKNVLIGALIALAVFLCARIVRIENERYALYHGLCKSATMPMLNDPSCLRTIQTRTSWTWHLYHALTD